MHTLQAGTQVKVYLFPNSQLHCTSDEATVFPSFWVRKHVCYRSLLLLSCFSCFWLCATHRRKPTRLPRPWDSPGKNTGVGCHFLLQCMKVKSESEIAHLCLTPSDPMDCGPPGSSIHGILQARILEWGAIAFSTLQVIVTEWNTFRTAHSPLLCGHVHSGS